MNNIHDSYIQPRKTKSYEELYKTYIECEEMNIVPEEVKEYVTYNVLQR